MFLHINDQMRTAELQERFSDCYPGLVIKFYRSPKTNARVENSKVAVAGEERIGEIRHDGLNGALELKSWYTVAKAEKLLSELYGLQAKIRCESCKDYQQGRPYSHLTLQALSSCQQKGINRPEGATASFPKNEFPLLDETIELENILYLTR